MRGKSAGACGIVFDLKIGELERRGGCGERMYLAIEC